MREEKMIAIGDVAVWALWILAITTALIGSAILLAKREHWPFVAVSYMAALFMLGGAVTVTIRQMLGRQRDLWRRAYELGLDVTPETTRGLRRVP